MPDDAWSVDDLPDTRIPGTDSECIRREMNACIRGVLEELPENYRTVLLLSEFEELSNREIAEILDLSLQSVKIRLIAPGPTCARRCNPSAASTMTSATNSCAIASRNKSNFFLSRLPSSISLATTPFFPHRRPRFPVSETKKYPTRRILFRVLPVYAYKAGKSEGLEEIMSKTGCCGMGGKAETNGGYEVVRIEKATNSCHLCEQHAEGQKAKPVAVMCCEGACLRGEVARQAANILCHTLAPDQTARICLGGAFTKDTGQRNLVRSAARVISVEGCAVNCASRMMAGVIEGLAPEVVIADRLYDFDRKLFGMEEMTAAEIQGHACTVAGKIAASL